MRHTQANTPSFPSSSNPRLVRLTSIVAGTVVIQRVVLTVHVVDAQHVHCSAVEGEGEEMSEAVLGRGRVAS